VAEQQLLLHWGFAHFVAPLLENPVLPVHPAVSFSSSRFLSAKVDFSSVLNKSRFSPSGFVRVRQAA